MASRCTCFDDIADFNIFALLCAAIEQLDHAFSDFFPDRDAIRNADQIRIFELHARALVAIVKQNLETRSLQFFVKLLAGFTQIVLFHVCDRDDHVKRRERFRPDDPVVVVVLFDGGG